MSHESSVSRSYRKFSPAAKADFGDDVIAGFSANTSIYASPTKTIAQLTSINNTLRTKNTAADSGAETDINDRDEYIRLTWLPAFDLDALYVESIALGNPNTIVLSGYDATKTTNTAHSLPIQPVLSATGGASGEIKYQTKTVIDSHAFTTIAAIAGDAEVIQMADHIVIKANKATDIIIITNTTKKGNILGLTRKDEYDVQMTATNGIGTGPISAKSNVIVP
jgi:hypothetical protein